MSDDEGKQIDFILILFVFSDMKKDKGKKKKDEQGSDESDESDGGNDIDMSL